MMVTMIQNLDRTEQGQQRSTSGLIAFNFKYPPFVLSCHVYLLLSLVMRTEDTSRAMIRWQLTGARPLP
jgi:hypothetical protein